MCSDRYLSNKTEILKNLTATGKGLHSSIYESFPFHRRRRIFIFLVDETLDSSADDVVF